MRRLSRAAVDALPADERRIYNDKVWLDNTLKRFKEAVESRCKMSYDRGDIIADALRMFAVSDSMSGTLTAGKLNQAATLIDGKV